MNYIKSKDMLRMHRFLIVFLSVICALEVIYVWLIYMAEMLYSDVLPMLYSDFSSLKMFTKQYLHQRNGHILQIILSLLPPLPCPQPVDSYLSECHWPWLLRCILVCLCAWLCCRTVSSLRFGVYIPSIQHSAWHIVGRQMFVEWMSEL